MPSCAQTLKELTGTFESQLARRIRDLDEQHQRAGQWCGTRVHRRRGRAQGTAPMAQRARQRPCCEPRSASRPTRFGVCAASWTPSASGARRSRRWRRWSRQRPWPRHRPTLAAAAQQGTRICTDAYAAAPPWRRRVPTRRARRARRQQFEDAKAVAEAARQAAAAMGARVQQLQKQVDQLQRERAELHRRLDAADGGSGGGGGAAATAKRRRAAGRTG